MIRKIAAIVISAVGTVLPCFLAGVVIGMTAETLYGFRYAIYLLAIGLGFEQCSQG